MSSLTVAPDPAGPVTNGTTADLATMLQLLDREPDEQLSICHEVGNVFSATLTTVAEAAQVAAMQAAGDCWFGAQVLHRRVSGGRGLMKDVIGVRDLYADLDVKAGGMPTYEAAYAVIDDLSGLLGAHPVAIVKSGHGLQPHWAIERDTATDWTDESDPRWLDAVALFRRWGRLVQTVALRRGGDRDGVFDLSRVLRVPGTVNRKNPMQPVRVTVTFPGGTPVSLGRVAEACAETDVVAEVEDREVLGEVIAAHGEWTFTATTCRYVAAMLNPAGTDDPFAPTAGLAGDTPKARHPWLVSQSVRLAAAHRLGCISEQDHARAVAIISTRFRELMKTGTPVREEGKTEISQALNWGIVTVETFTENRARTELGGKEKPHTHPQDVPDLADFWAARPVLAHIRDFAQARRCSPWSVLGVVLVRVVTAVPPDVVLPAMVGSEASLNIFVASVGPSGGGKGASDSAAADAVAVGAIEVATVGSGEGIGHLYAHREKGVVIRDRNAVLFTVPEVDNLTALGNRQGATLMPQLRSAWSGEKLGFSYADKNKALPIERHTYRMGLVLGVQPGRAAPLLDDADGGTPQRFVWLPTSDPAAPDVAPPCPTTWPWKPVGRRDADYRGLTVLPVAQVAREAIDAATLSRLRGQGDPLDGHRLLCRLKVAAALGLLDGRLEVDEDDWDLAGQLMTVSDATRAGVVAHLAQQAAKANEMRGESEGTRAVAVAEKLEGAKVKRVGRNLMRRMAKVGGWMTHRDIATGISGPDRGAVAEALELLISAGQVEVKDEQDKQLYRLANGGAK